MIPIYTTCPQVGDVSPQAFRQRLVNTAMWSEAAGCRGVLTYTDNVSLDPWTVAQTLIQHTDRLVPLVAVNPVDIHPYAVTRMISTFGLLYERQVDLNLVTGGFKRHLRQVGCRLAHDDRYDRLTEFGTIITRLLTGACPVTFSGDYFQVNNLALTPPLPSSLKPRVFVSGVSDACRRMQTRLGAVRLSYPREISEYERGDSLEGCGLRLGIIARDTADLAWRVARKRFPRSLEGEEIHDIAAEQVESQWHRVLSQDALQSDGPQGTYWIYPFRAYHTLCPYLVGSYHDVSNLLLRYFSLGVAALILDTLTEQDDLCHAMVALTMAEEALSASRRRTPVLSLPDATLYEITRRHRAECLRS